MKEVAAKLDGCRMIYLNGDGRFEESFEAEPDTRLIASVAYFPEKYGGDLVRVALDILNLRLAPPPVFVKHQLVTSKTVDHYDPNDPLLAMAAGM